MHAFHIFAGETALHGGVGSHTHKYRIVFAEQFIDLDIFSDFGVETEFHTHALENFPARADN